VVSTWPYVTSLKIIFITELIKQRSWNDLLPALWTHPGWSEGIKCFASAVKLEIILHSYVDAMVSKGVVDNHFPSISGLGDTRIKEISVWHGVRVLGMGPNLQWLACMPACGLRFIQQRDSIWHSTLADQEDYGKENELMVDGWKIVRSKRY
jgi:hypothetical protein